MEATSAGCFSITESISGVRVGLDFKTLRRSVFSLLGFLVAFTLFFDFSVFALKIFGTEVFSLCSFLLGYQRTKRKDWSTGDLYLLMRLFSRLHFLL